MTLSFQAFPTRDAMFAALADDVAELLIEAVAARGEALLLATGGVAVIPFYETLAARSLPWARITVLPSDARWLPEDQDGSNDGMIRRTLLQGPGAAARFEPLYGAEPTPEAALPRLRALFDTLPPADVALLGIGEDGHTAAFFKGSRGFDAAVDPHGPATFVSIYAPNGAMTPHRLTLTLPALLQARAVRLMFFGEAKRALYDAALRPGPVEELPVRTILYQDKTPVEVYWAA